MKGAGKGGDDGFFRGGGSSIVLVWWKRELERWGVCVCVCVERVMRLARFFLGNSFWVDDDVLLD